MQVSRGFTFIELLVVLAIIAILSAIAAPSFRTMTLSNRLTSTSNSLLGALQIARSEAVMLRSAVKVCAANSAQSACESSTDWSNGILIMRGTKLLRLVPAKNTGVNVAASINEIIYQGNGTTNAATVTVSDERGSSFEHIIKINAIGQACSGSSCP